MLDVDGLHKLRFLSLASVSIGRGLDEDEVSYWCKRARNIASPPTTCPLICLISVDRSYGRVETEFCPYYLQ